MAKTTSRQLSLRRFALTIPGGAILVLLLGLFWAFSAAFEPVAADHEGLAPVQNVYSVTFVTSNQNKWGPAGDASPSPLTLDLIPDTTWNVSGDAEFFFNTPASVDFEGEPIAIPNGTFGGAISGSTTGEIALGMEFKDFGLGAVGVDYPIEAVLTTPAAESFNLGDTITIDSSFVVLPGAELSTESPDAGTVSLDGTLGLTFATQVEACIFDCADFSIPDFGINPPVSGSIVSIEFPERVSLDSLELAESIINGTLPAAFETEVRNLIGNDLYNILLTKSTFEVASIIDNLTPLGTFGGHIGLPDLDTTSALEDDGTTLTASGEDDFVELEVDSTGYFTSVPLGFKLFPLCVGGFCATFNINIAAVTSVTSLTQEEEYEFQARPCVMLQFPEDVTWSINNCVLDSFSNIDPSNPASCHLLGNVTDRDIRPGFQCGYHLPSFLSSGVHERHPDILAA